MFLSSEGNLICLGFRLKKHMATVVGHQCFFPPKALSSEMKDPNFNYESIGSVFPQPRKKFYVGLAQRKERKDTGIEEKVHTTRIQN